jgi:dTDP-4-amino-4,6-dideoxygalactose transaminase
MGEEVAAFEKEFSEYLGLSHCISVANGSEALELALRGLGVGPGDRVITVANAGFYSSTAIHAVGAEPIYVDVDPVSLTMCPILLKKALSVPAKVVIITHLYGQLAEIETLVSIAKSADAMVLEDCAQSHGASRNGKLAGSYGDIACFSFYPTKNLGALGDGGAIATDNLYLAERVIQLRQYGWSKKYEVSLQGGRNSRLDEMQAAILRQKLALLDSWNAQRRDIAKRYNEAFANLDMLLPPSIDEDYVAHLYVIRLKNRRDFAAFLKNRNISTDVHYPIPDHLQPAYRLSQSPCLTVTEIASQDVISLPCFPGLTDFEVQRVINAVSDYFSKGA